MAAKICERLLKSPDARKLKELWLTLVYIHRCNKPAGGSGTSSSGSSSDQHEQNVEETIRNCLDLFPHDAQITYISAQFYASIVRKINQIKNFSLFLLLSFFFSWLIKKNYFFAYRISHKLQFN